MSAGPAMRRDFHDNLISPDARIIDTLRIIDGHGVPIGLVHDNGRLIGTVTDGDIRRGILAGTSLDAPVSKVMNVSPKRVLQGTPDAVIRKMMQVESILYVPVVDGRDQIVDLKVLKDMLAEGASGVASVADMGAETEEPATPMENAVVIMAGGKGERLRPLTEDRPKPMVEINGRPILETIVERFVHQGFTKLYLSVNYRKAVIENHFGDGSKWGAHITYLHEDQPLGTAGALGLLPERPTKPIVVMNGDLITRVNFRQLVAFHDHHKAPATMAVWETRFVVPYGVVSVDGVRLTAIEEKPVTTSFINAGIYVLAPEMLDLIPKGRLFNITNLFAAQISRGQGKVGGAPVVFPLREPWIDIGRVADVARAERGEEADNDLRNVIREF